MEIFYPLLMLKLQGMQMLDNMSVPSIALHYIYSIKTSLDIRVTDLGKLQIHSFAT